MSQFEFIAVPPPESKFNFQELKGCLARILRPGIDYPAAIYQALYIGLDDYAKTFKSLPENMGELESFLAEKSKRPNREPQL